MSKYIDFELRETKTKTGVYDILTKSKVYLGRIKWHPTWRRYAFFPTVDTIWDQDCLRDVISFITKVEEERRKNQNE